MHTFGGSVVVAATGDILKIHVHTDSPEAVFSYAARWGRVETTKADDMRAQHRRLAHPSGAPSPSWPTAPPTCPTRCWTAITSRWSRSRWCSATRPFAIGSSSSRRSSTAGSARRGTCPPRPSRRPRISSGCSATPGRKPTRWSPSSCPVDCRAPSPRPKPRCAPEGSAVSTWWTAGPRHWGSGCSRSAGPSWRSPAGAGRRSRGSWSGCGARSGMLLTVDRYDNLLRSGRVSRGKAWLAGMLDVKPILSLDASGRVIPVDRVRGRDQVVSRVLAVLDRASHPAPEGDTIRGGSRPGP